MRKLLLGTLTGLRGAHMDLPDTFRPKEHQQKLAPRRLCSHESDAATEIVSLSMLP